jgi:hypothetical protein
VYAIATLAKSLHRALLERIWAEDAPPYLRSLPAVETLRQCWVSQYWEQNGVLRWRHSGNLPPCPARIDSMILTLTTE